MLNLHGVVLIAGILLLVGSGAIDWDPSTRDRGSPPVVHFGRSRVPATGERTRGRSKESRRTYKSEVHQSSRTTQGGVSQSLEGGASNLSYFDQRLGKDSAGRDLFRWTGKEYVLSVPGSTRVSSKKTTKTTTSIIGTGRSGEGFVYRYPEKKTVTTYSNTTIYKSGISEDYAPSRKKISTSESSQDRYSYYGRGRPSYGEDDRAKPDVGYGKEYHRNTEQESFQFGSLDSEFAKGIQLEEEDLVHPFVLHGLGSHAGQDFARSCERRSCYPATGNLLIGRESGLSATSTCGLYQQEKYCIVSHLKNQSACFWCDSHPRFDRNPTISHKIHNIIYRFDRRTQRRSWWQSESGVEEASIRLDLEAEFHFTHLIITFRTFRPAAMLIERSFDFGKTWKVYRYFAYDCKKSFPDIPPGPPRSISDVVCEMRYSAVEPSTEGEVIFRVLPPNIQITDPYSDEVQNLLKITNLRVNFTKLHTLGDQLLDNRPEIKEKYYYAVYEMVVRGSCSCYGHASQCLPLAGVADKPNMVHGRCECTHNTQGLNCEKCLDFFNDLPWKPAVADQSNACKRCNCNDHATLCHFDNNVYEASGRVSGGVCDECQHNTQGHHCEECQPFFYQDPTKDIRDPNVCQPCGCNLRRSLNEGICDSRTDIAAGTLAGRCHCKANVDGLKCDFCKAGFWNFSDENPFGCQECSCDLLGTVGNTGCDEASGECLCKRFVTGRDCNQCLPQHYGLSEHPDGCQPCGCDRGGALDNDCDVITGQCKCRPHVVGRRCDQPEEGFYVPSLNYFTYEAELAKGSELYCEEESLFVRGGFRGGNCQVVMREPEGSGGATWTGLGFMRVFHGSHLEFEIENIETSMEYDFVIRYEPQFRGDWEHVTVNIERPDRVDPEGPCADSRPTEDHFTVALPEGARHYTLYPPVCLEKDKRYKVRMDFRRVNPQVDTASASILIDSISLIPRAENLPFYHGSLESDESRQEYTRYRCSEPFYDSRGLTTIPEVCLSEHLDSIGYYVYKQAFACQCDATGSESSICDTLGGQCKCKPNVAGRRCDHCAPGTYGFGPQGCTPCGCNNVGSLDNFCDLTSGQCKCKPNTYGRQCNECQPGFWNFPNCQRCECNGHADTCDSHAGFCHDCRDNTTGPNCALCLEGFYGDPRLESGIACRPCPCPGRSGSGHSFADRCHLDPHTKDVICDCFTGYTGSRCDVCADNYYGNPEIPGGLCHLCDCNNNIDISRPGNCDSKTGECLQCLANTAGFNCGRCKEGYYGDALSQQCRECVCNILGADQTASGVCDHLTGQCPCHPNVLGVECDRCAPFHWKIASGIGCEHCACDPVGSFSEQCNEFDGQCDCRQGFGGRQCNQCQTNFYGDPRVQCLPCNCTYEGSETLQCDHTSGKCRCREGIGGFKCDECARGFTGRAPYCRPCGECFDNWDVSLTQLKERTEALIASASKIKQSGATGAYSHEFQTMENMLEDVRSKLTAANATSETLDDMQQTIEELSKNIKLKEMELRMLEEGVDNTTQRISLASNNLEDIYEQTSDLKTEAQNIKDRATKLQEANVEGALNLTRLASTRSEDAERKAKLTQVTVAESVRNRKRTDNFLLHAGDRFNRTRDTNENKLKELSMTVAELEESIPELNRQVCDGTTFEKDALGNYCNLFCGGARCGKCGGLSCNSGLVNTAKLAHEFAQDAEKALQMKEAYVDELLRSLSGAKRQSSQAAEKSQMAYEETISARNFTSNYKNIIRKLLKEIDMFFNTPSALPNEVRIVANETLGFAIKLRPGNITALADKINQKIDLLTNIDLIINATKNNLNLAVTLKARADKVKGEAEMTLEVAQRVVDALKEAGEAQHAAESAISEATQDISKTEVYLTQIASETSDAQGKANTSLRDVEDLRLRVDSIKSEHTINERHLADTVNAINDADLNAQRASNEVSQLEDSYQNVVQSLHAKSTAAEDARKRADALKKRANKLSAEAYSKLQLLKDMSETFAENEKLFLTYEEEIRKMEIRMEEYHSYILKKTEMYTSCQT